MPYFSTAAETTEYSRQEKEYQMMCVKLYIKYRCQELGIRTTVSTRPETKAHIFATVNPPPSIELTQFLTTIDNSKPWIGSYMYVIEQRGLPDINIGYGLHTHILLHLNRRVQPSIFTREIKNTYQTWCRNLSNIKHQEC